MVPTHFRHRSKARTYRHRIEVLEVDAAAYRKALRRRVRPVKANRIPVPLADTSRVPDSILESLKSMHKANQERERNKEVAKQCSNNAVPVVPEFKPYVDPRPVIKHANDSMPFIPEGWRKKER